MCAQDLAPIMLLGCKGSAMLVRAAMGLRWIQLVLLLRNQAKDQNATRWGGVIWVDFLVAFGKVLPESFASHLARHIPGPRSTIPAPFFHRFVNSLRPFSIL